MPVPSSVIARRAFTNSSRAKAVSRSYRSTRRIAFTARPATSRTRLRTSTGSHPKAAEALITRTCKLLLTVAVAALALAPASAGAAIGSNPERDYVEARAAAMSGDHARSAQLLAALAETQPDQIDLARKALSEAIGAGQMDLALNVAARLPAAKLPTEARLMLAANEVKRRRYDRAIAWLQASGDNADLTFLSPLLNAWDAAEKGDVDRAL